MMSPLAHRNLSRFFGAALIRSFPLFRFML
jgi:hypothetical protein